MGDKPDADGEVSYREVGQLFGLVVHDVRNPVATISANVGFLSEGGLIFEDEDAEEAFEDLRLAVQELQRGLEQIGWVTRWLLGEPSVALGDGEPLEAARRAAERIEGLQVDLEASDELKGASVRRAGPGLVALLALLLRNSRQHAPDRRARLRLQRFEDRLCIELYDAGPRIDGALGERVFSLPGQYAAKREASGGRYGRYLELLAARSVADTLGARLEVGRGPEEPVFRVTLPLD